ncbi:uncharacterized protein Fot_03387 [Forsythia ovata]|uniref:Uncharacterized protein n=1 Tax=Forsythia ovata TaxID=205694 RepID=A0ABD1XCN8_9LAMI
MGGISVLIYYDGVWDESRTYSDYSIVGLVVPLDCSYVNLIDMIMREIKKDQSHYEVTVKYQILSNGPLISICTDTSLSFYIEIRKNESNMRQFPLCVNVHKLACSGDSMMTIVSEPGTLGICETMNGEQYTLGGLGNSIIPKLPTIEEMGLKICQNVSYGDESVEETRSNVLRIWDLLM